MVEDPHKRQQFIDFLVARGRLLSEHGERRDDPGVLDRMRACAANGRRFGYRYFLRALEAPTEDERSVA